MENLSRSTRPGQPGLAESPHTGSGSGRRLAIDPERFPLKLRERPQWLGWRLINRPDPKTGKPKPTKVPFCARDPARPADSTDPSTWATFAEALAALNDPANQLSGIGYVFAPDDPFVGIDLDHCVGPDRIMEPWAAEILDGMPSWAEWSQSGDGAHIIIMGRLTHPDRPKPKHRKNGMGSHPRSGVEIYDQGRYFCMTGNQVEGTPATVENCAEALEALYSQLWPAAPELKPHDTNGKLVTRAPATERRSGNPDEAERFKLARGSKNGVEFSALYDHGDSSRYGGDESAADMALMNLLAFWFGPDEAALERLFSGSALGQREKWTGRPDYRERTIATALEGRTEFYEPRGLRRNASEKNRGAGSGAQTNGNGPTPPPPLAPPVAQPDQINCTDMGNAERLIRRFGNDLLYCHPWGKWVRWDGTRWARDVTGEVARLGKQTVRGILPEAAAADDPKRRAELAAWSIRSEEARRINNLIGLAACEVPILPEALDRHPWLLNCINGTLELKTGELRPHRPADLLTAICPTPYEPGAQCPTWEATLKRVFVDPVLIAFWQQLCGYCLTGAIHEHILAILYGVGANGKSTLVNAILAVLGGDYSMIAAPGLLMEKRNETHPTEESDLFGKRFVVCVETGQHARISEVAVKRATGGDRMRVRRMREDFWEFDPTHKIMLCTNHKPEIRGTDWGIWRRIRLTPFDVIIPESDQDVHLPEKLRGEAPGILAWMVRGCADWSANGLFCPPAVTVATQEYRSSEDVLASFIEDKCFVNSGMRTGATALYKAYQVWAERSGESILPQRKLGEAMSERGFRRFVNNGKWYQGIGLRQDDEDIQT